MPLDTNTQTFRRRAFLVLIALILIPLAIAMPGCATIKPTTEGEPSSFMPNWAETLELPPANGELTGFSKRSREIESRLLGIK